LNRKDPNFLAGNSNSVFLSKNYQGSFILTVYLFLSCKFFEAWNDNVIPHPINKEREIFKHHDVVENFLDTKIEFRFYYDRVKGSQATKTKEKKVYCKKCKKHWSGKDADKGHGHKCPLQFVPSNGKSASELIMMYRASYEDTPNALQSLTLLIIDSNSSFALAKSKFVKTLPLSVGAQANKIPAFYDKKVTKSLKAMGNEKYMMNRRYQAAVGTSQTSIDSVDIAD
jgi:hypothetical protein